MKKQRVEVVITPGVKRVINFNYSRDMKIASNILSFIQKPLIKCKIDIHGIEKDINGNKLYWENTIKEARKAKAALLKYPLLTPEQKTAIESVNTLERLSLSATRPEAICTLIARNMRDVVNTLCNDYDLKEQEATDIILLIVKGWFPDNKSIQSIKLESFQRTIRKL